MTSQLTVNVVGGLTLVVVVGLMTSQLVVPAVGGLAPAVTVGRQVHAVYGRPQSVLRPAGLRADLAVKLDTPQVVQSGGHVQQSEGKKGHNNSGWPLTRKTANQGKVRGMFLMKKSGECQ